MNDVLRQESDIDQMLLDVPSIIAELSRFYALRAGDLIFTGTPAGVGALKPGDRVEGGIDGLETLRHTHRRRRCRPVKLYGFFRSSASYRARIALNYKGLAYESIEVDLRAGTSAQRSCAVPGPEPGRAGARAGRWCATPSASHWPSPSTSRRRTRRRHCCRARLPSAPACAP